MCAIAHSLSMGISPYRISNSMCAGENILGLQQPLDNSSPVPSDSSFSSSVVVVIVTVVAEADDVNAANTAAGVVVGDAAVDVTVVTAAAADVTVPAAASVVTAAAATRSRLCGLLMTSQREPAAAWSCSCCKNSYVHSATNCRATLFASIFGNLDLEAKGWFFQFLLLCGQVRYGSFKHFSANGS